MSESAKLAPEQKAAAVIVALGADKASQIYKYLGEEDVEKLTVEVAKLGRIDSEKSEQVLDEFYKTCLTQKFVTDGGLEYARSVLEHAYGESTASDRLTTVPRFL